MWYYEYDLGDEVGIKKQGPRAVGKKWISSLHLLNVEDMYCIYCMVQILRCQGSSQAMHMRVTVVSVPSTKSNHSKPATSEKNRRWIVSSEAGAEMVKEMSKLARRRFRDA